MKKFPFKLSTLTLALLVSLSFRLSFSQNQNVVEEVLEGIKKDVRFGGVVAILSRVDGTSDVGVFGMSNDDTPLSIDMSMGIGSCTKTFTSTLIYKLIEENKLSLDDTLGKLLPEVVNDKIDSKITIKQLLTHSSGIYDPIDNLVTKVFGNPTYKYSTDEHLSYVNEAVFNPGEKHSYSNTNYFLLGLIIEKVTGGKYHEYLRKVIFDPLKLPGTYLSGKEKPRNKVGYSWMGEQQSLENFPREGVESLAWSSGSIFSTLKDMVVWQRALFGGKIINKTSLSEMTKTYPGDMEYDFGSGIFSYKYKGQQLYMHAGGTIAYSSVVIYNSTNQDVISLIINQMQVDPISLALKIVDANK